jgi:transposase
VSMGVEKLSKLLIRVSRGRFGKEMAAQLYEAARTSTGVRAGQECRIEEIWSLLDLIEAHERDIDKFEKLMKEKLAGVSYAKYLLSFPGIGELTVAGLIGEMSHFPSFHSAEAALRFGGLNLYEISSGSSKGSRKISKRGRPLIRKILYFATMGMVRTGRIFHHDYQQMLGEGKEKNVALIALARRLMRIMYALVHNETNYVEDYQSCSMRQAA